MALTAALASAARALDVYSTSVQVTANNIANAGTPGYIRDQVKIEASQPYSLGSLIIGTGVRMVAIQQVVNQFLEKRIQSASSDASAASARQDIYSQLEQAIGELSGTDLSSQLSSFQAGIEEVVNQPEQSPLRANLIDIAGNLAKGITTLRSRIDGLRKDQATTVNTLVDEGNRLIDQIQDLNRQISLQESNGILRSDAGSLRTERYSALRRLSEIIPIHYQERANGIVDVASGGNFVVLDGQKQHLVTDTYADRGLQVQRVIFDKTQSPITEGGGGELLGVIDGRDEILGGFVDKLDSLTNNLIDQFNRVHSSGEGIDGYSSVTSTNRVSDSNVSLAQAGLPFDIQNGSFTLKVTNQQTGITTSHRINIELNGLSGSDTTLEDLRSQIDGLDNVSATISTTGQLQLTADSGFDLKFADDSSRTLAALGINTFFTGDDSLSIGVNPAIVNNVNLFATGKGGGPGDNTNVTALAQVLDQPVSTLNGLSITDFYNSAANSVAQGSSSEQATARGLASYRDSLQTQRDQYSGVSLDEEAIHLIQLQQAYGASARVIRVVDELYQTLIGL